MRDTKSARRKNYPFELESIRPRNKTCRPTKRKKAQLRKDSPREVMHEARDPLQIRQIPMLLGDIAYLNTLPNHTLS